MLKRLCFRLLLIGLAAGLAFGVGEWLCRILSPPPHIRLDGLTRAQSHASLPCELTAGFSGVNDGIAIRTNRHGWRDREWGPKSPDRPRILLLGDSFVLGLNVPLDLLLGRQIEQKLGAGSEVCMAGCIYYNTTNELEIARRLVPLLQPDLILVAYVMNDAEPNHTTESAYQIYHEIEAWLTARSRLLFFTRRAVHFLVTGTQHRTGAHDYTEALYADAQPGWIENQRALRDFGELSRTTGIPVGFIIWPALHYLDENHPYKPLYAKIEEVLRKAGVSHLNLLPFFLSQPPESLWVSKFDTHPNARAYAIAAEATRDFIQRENLLRRTESRPAERSH